MSTLIAFERAGRELSFKRAADALGLTPSAISHQIRGLEDAFGVRLFTRGARQVGLTPAGQRYLEVVSRALAELHEAARDLRAESTEGSYEMRISALPFFASVVMLPALGRLRKTLPALCLRLEATHSYADFDAHSVDLAIRFGRERSVGLRLEPLIEVRVIPVCAPALAAHLRDFADLADAPLIHLAVQPRAWPAWFEAAGIVMGRRQDDLWVDSVPAALEAAEHGLGVALAMHPLIHGRPGFGSALVAPFCTIVGPANTIHLAMRPETAQRRPVRVVRQWLAESLNSLQLI